MSHPRLGDGMELIKAFLAIGGEHHLPAFAVAFAPASSLFAMTGLTPGQPIAVSVVAAQCRMKKLWSASSSRPGRPLTLEVSTGDGLHIFVAGDNHITLQ